MPKPWTTIAYYQAGLDTEYLGSNSKNPKLCETARKFQKGLEHNQKVTSNHRNALNPPRKLN